MINGLEDYLDRLRRQPGWDLSQLSDVALMICGNGEGMTKTLALAALSSGFRSVVLVGARKRRSFLVSVSDHVMQHLGLQSTYIPVYSVGFLRACSTPTFGCRRVWIIDAGDEGNDALRPEQEMSYYYANCEGEDGDAFIAVGKHRDEVAGRRKGSHPCDRAEIPAACSLLLISIIADLGVCSELEPQPPFCRIPLPRLPESIPLQPSAILYAGGGGAIAHQIIWAESLDPLLRDSNRRGHIVIVDQKDVHESCRSRQWGYGPAALNESKAQWTAIWLNSLFPGVEVSFFDEALKETHFQGVSLQEAVSSLDTWTARRLLADIATVRGLPFWSAGTSFLGGFARQISPHNHFCTSAYDGVERLGERPDDDPGAGTSCSAASTPFPSSVLPQMIVGSYIACQRRAVLLGTGNQVSLARGIEVHMERVSREPGCEGLRWSQGRRLNLRRNSL